MHTRAHTHVHVYICITTPTEYLYRMIAHKDLRVLICTLRLHVHMPVPASLGTG